MCVVDGRAIETEERGGKGRERDDQEEAKQLRRIGEFWVRVLGAEKTTQQHLEILESFGGFWRC